MLLQDARREARLDEAGDLVILEEQDRSRWNQAQIAEALPLVEEALRGGPGPFALQAAIAACTVGQPAPRIPTGLRSSKPLRPARPRPAFAGRVAQPGGGGGDGATGLSRRSGLSRGPPPPAIWKSYHLLHAARADLLRRPGFPEKRPRATLEPWNWSPTKASAGFCSGACAKFSPRQRERPPSTVFAGIRFRTETPFDLRANLLLADGDSPAT